MVRRHRGSFEQDHPYFNTRQTKRSARHGCCFGKLLYVANAIGQNVLKIKYCSTSVGTPVLSDAGYLPVDVAASKTGYVYVSNNQYEPADFYW